MIWRTSNHDPSDPGGGLGILGRCAARYWAFGLAGSAAPGAATGAPPLGDATLPAAAAGSAGFSAALGAGAGMGAGESALLRRKAIRLMRSLSLRRPAKLILVPGISTPGALMNLNSSS